MENYPHYIAGTRFGREALVRTLMGYIGAVVVAHVVGSVAAAQHVIGRFEAMAGDVDLSERLRWTVGDVIGMATGAIYPIAIAVALLLAFAVAGFIVRRAGLFSLRTIGFVLAGAVGLLVMHLVLNSVAEINPVAATREIAGLGWQAFAGALAGAAYIGLHPAKAKDLG